MLRNILLIFAVTIPLSFLTHVAHAQVSASHFPSTVAYDVTATIAIGTSTTVSDAVDLKGGKLSGIFIPSTFDGTALTLTASNSLTGTFVAVTVDHTSSAAYTVTTTASRYVPLANVELLRGLRYIKIVTSSAQTTTDTVFTLAVKP